ncbi:acyltransferase family protein [Aeromicrobium sp. Sec7.5]|uniref:acyltransferase family protein n=1 Tax=Aeromicrobium sp. Sec7.5 TaxID=3121276 RepID=UPI002FE4CB0E
MSVQSRTYAELDGLRAVAAIAVVGTHTAFWAGIYGEGVLGALTHRLEIGVAIFFVLSGFLLGRPWVSRALDSSASAPTRGSVRRYYRKRFFRIFPVYVLTVVAAMVLLPANRDEGVGVWVQNLTLVAHLGDPELPAGLTQMWSLTVEASFYLALPLIGWCLVRVGRGSLSRLMTALGALALLSIGWNIVSWGLDSGLSVALRAQLPSHLGWFVAGIALAALATDADSASPSTLTRRASRLAADRATCWIAAGAVLVLVATPLGGPVGLFQPDLDGALVRHVGYAVVSLLLVAPCVLAPRPTSWLAHPLARHLGHTSFALFCCHLIVIELIVPGLGLTQFEISWPLLLVLVLAISQAVSEVLYRVVERPANRLGHRRSSAAATTRATASTPHH